jgi:SAM-dependent methyltransferase
MVAARLWVGQGISQERGRRGPRTGEARGNQSVWIRGTGIGIIITRELARHFSNRRARLDRSCGSPDQVAIHLRARKLPLRGQQKAVRMRPWGMFLERYREGQWRAPLFRDLILADLRSRAGGPTLLDIGCGGGFDDDPKLQASLAWHAGRYIGVEPNAAGPLPNFFDETHRCPLEDAPIPLASVHVAYAVMVLEHLRDPRPFFDRLHALLAPGGTFWALTMDARHWFCTASLAARHLGVKTLYLNFVWGRPGRDRYQNYPAYYRANTPAQIRRLAAAFQSVRCASFAREGQLDRYLPSALRPLGRYLDRRAIARNRPGPLLAIRLEK